MQILFKRLLFESNLMCIAAFYNCYLLNFLRFSKKDKDLLNTLIVLPLQKFNYKISDIDQGSRLINDLQ